MRHTKMMSAVALAIVLAACGSPDQSADAWGSEAEQFLEELARAYRANDTYAVLDFYAPSAEIEVWRGDNKGGGPVSDQLIWNSGDLGQAIQAVHLGADQAVTLVRWPAEDLGAVVSTIEDGHISGQTVFELATSLGRSLRASPGVIATYEGLYASYAEAWSGAPTADIGRLYAPDARVRDQVSDIDVVGRDAIAALAVPGHLLALTATDTVGEDAPIGAAPLYLGPAPYGRDPQRAVGVYQVANEDGCLQQVAVKWLIDDGLIVEESRYHEIDSFRLCSPDDTPAGWWTGLELPGPRDQEVTGYVRTAIGQEIPVHNGTPSLDELLEWGLQRFVVAGLTEPRLDSVTFEPSRECAGVSGRVDDSGSTRDLFLCIYESDLCPGDAPCAVAARGVRFAILHELGHAWMLDQVSEDGRRRLLESSGRATWRASGVPWADLGVEYAAEVMAWGLSEEAIPMVRLGSPPCDELMAAFEILTNATPPRAGADCGQN